MGARVIVAFRHRNTGRIWRVGEEFEGAAAAERELAARGFLVRVEPRPLESPEGDGLESMTVRQLVLICDEERIETPGKPRKADLVAAIRAARGGE